MFSTNFQIENIDRYTIRKKEMIVRGRLVSRELNINPHGVRLTASEPNMLKVRLKARVIERRASPLARRPLKTRIKQRSKFPRAATCHPSLRPL